MKSYQHTIFCGFVLSIFIMCGSLKVGADTLPLSPQKPFLINLYPGNTHPDILQLQKYLNNSGFTVATQGIGSKGYETMYFGQYTKEALIRFQEQYASEILTPFGLTKGTGMFLESTRNFINKASTTPKIKEVVVLPIQTPRHRSGNKSAHPTSNQTTITLTAPSITFADFTKNYGVGTFTLSPSSNSAGAFSFTSSNTKVATVSGNSCTVLGAGTSNITTNQAANGNFLSGTKTTTITVLGVCDISSPCLNGGVCTNTSTIPQGPLDTYTCACSPGFSGQTCLNSTTNCDGTTGTCNNGGTCVPDPSGGSCNCAPCFTGASCDIFDVQCG